MKEYKKKRKAEKGISKEEREKNNQYLKSYRARKKSIEFFISKFHDIVSQGPLYICTCCDQMFYKHSVLQSSNLRQKNPDIHKYLTGKTSVNNTELVCQTCFKYLCKNKVPPCAIVNGMQFPHKPAFFDLNELECILLAPRIALQKLMQAPRGRQLKIHDNIVNVPADVNNTVSMFATLTT